MTTLGKDLPRLCPSPVPVRHQCSPLVLVGCHGGAGTSTLTLLLGPPAIEALDLDDAAAALWDGLTVVLVATGTVRGARLATEAVALLRHASPGPRLAVVGATEVGRGRLLAAVVGDGSWPVPAAAMARLRLLADLVPVVRVPYVHRWRDEDNPRQVPPAYQQALRELRAGSCSCAEPALARRSSGRPSG